MSPARYLKSYLSASTYSLLHLFGLLIHDSIYSTYALHYLFMYLFEYPGLLGADDDGGWSRSILWSATGGVGIVSE